MVDSLNDQQAFASAIAMLSPDLARLREEFIVGFDEDLSPYVYVGAVAQRFVSELSQVVRSQLCELVEQALIEGSDDVQELVSVAFVENLPLDLPPWVWASFGPKLKADLHRWRTGYGGLPPFAE